MKTQHALQWTVGHAPDLSTRPIQFVAAQVPGAVQLDWARSQNWPDYTHGDNFKQYDGLENLFWTYETTLQLPQTHNGERTFFVCRGVDYQFEVRLKDEVIYANEGMFTPFEVDLTDIAQDGDTLQVVVFPAPKSRPDPLARGRMQADQSCKPAVSYGWDFHPRLIPLGIWDETYLETRSAQHITRTETLSQLTNEYSIAQIEATCEIAANAASQGQSRVCWTLSDASGNVVLSQESNVTSIVVFNATLETPQLWWPRGEGEAALYTSRFELVQNDETIDESSTRVGFRDVQLVMHPTAWDEPSGFPKSRSVPPITLQINGRRIFAKGSNWVAPHIFPGEITRETYQELLDLVAGANMNILRQWGGAIVNKDSFYEICDELGIMVWQEFPLACNNYEGTPDYLRVLDSESRSIIKRLRSHASLVLWCGGNELFNAWSGMTDQSLALRLLNRNCYDLAPHTPFLMTSPVMGMGHGSYIFRDPDGLEVFQLFTGANCTAYTEFGCSGPSNLDVIESVIPPAELFPPQKSTAWETHHAIGAWDVNPYTWLLLDVVEDYMGKCENVAQIVERGQFMQSEGYKCLFEEARRQKPTCSMALNWCLNEPWPTAANNSLINWPVKAKPALSAVGQSCRPTLASARIAKFRWNEGEVFDPELFLLHDAPIEYSKARVEAVLYIGDNEYFLLGWDLAGLTANENLIGPQIRFVLPHADAAQMKLSLHVPDHPEWDSEYTLMYVPRAAVTVDANAPRALNL
jgi:beta-mannosidase